ncbi:MAG: acetyl-CoA carboxylase biotin carboxyl carrier protein [Candidatus Hydrogenedens sp.]|nr:acetyl-CoA carboxylase biotin carboxyl carrier protein [Candidatus Hydrogenedens sp.]
MDITELKELMRLLEESTLSELEIEEDNRRVRLSKAVQAAYAPPMQQFAPPAAASAAAPAAPAAAPDDAEEAWAHVIESPMVGTFYSSPGPGEPPFVQAGARVSTDTTVCIIEAMKIMNEVAAKEDCIIERVLVESGQPVEFGQPLFAIRPTS